MNKKWRYWRRKMKEMHRWLNSSAYINMKCSLWDVKMTLIAYYPILLTNNFLPVKHMEIFFRTNLPRLGQNVLLVKICMCCKTCQIVPVWLQLCTFVLDILSFVLQDREGLFFFCFFFGGGGIMLPAWTLITSLLCVRLSSLEHSRYLWWSYL